MLQIHVKRHPCAGFGACPSNLLEDLAQPRMHPKPTTPTNWIAAKVPSGVANSKGCHKLLQHRRQTFQNFQITQTTLAPNTNKYVASTPLLYPLSLLLVGLLWAGGALRLYPCLLLREKDITKSFIPCALTYLTYRIFNGHSEHGLSSTLLHQAGSTWPATTTAGKPYSVAHHAQKKPNSRVCIKGPTKCTQIPANKPET